MKSAIFLSMLALGMASIVPQKQAPLHSTTKDQIFASNPVYEIVKSDNQTTIFARIITEFPDLVGYLNSTAASYTVFAPTDAAFSKIAFPPDLPYLYWKQLIAYHLVSGIYDQEKLLEEETLPTFFRVNELGGLPQRISTQVDFRRLSINFVARLDKADQVSVLAT